MSSPFDFSFFFEDFLGNLKAEDLVAKAVVENVNEAGEKNLKINVFCKDSNVNFEITDIKPSTVNVMFDESAQENMRLTLKPPI